MIYRVVIVGLLLASVGCGPREPPTYPVSGTVTLDGKPLAEGEVYFSLPGLTPKIYPIKDGIFEGKARAGTHRVEICAYRERKEKVGTPDMVPPPENYIPARFNAQSKLTAEVIAGGANRFEFPVQSGLE